MIQTIGLAYKDTIEKAKFDIKFIEVEKQTEFAGIKLSVAPTIHTALNHALRVEYNDKVLCYSGDGMYSDEAKELYRGADLLVHETYTLDKDIYGHGNIKLVSDIMEELKITQIAVVHIQRDIRVEKDKVISYIKGLNKNIIMPEAEEILEI